MDTSMLKAFIMLAESGTYHEAAKSLFITQSALTKKINRLESRLGLILFNRGRMGAQLTPSGQYLISSAQKIIEQENKLLAQAQDAAAGYIGKLNIGFGLSTLQIAPHLIALFQQDYTNTAITLNDVGSSEQIKKLLSGELSIGFTRLPVPHPLASYPLLTDELILAVNKNTVKETNIHDILTCHPFLRVSGKRGPGLAQQVNNYINEMRYPINVTQDTDDIQTLLALIFAGIGVSILPKSVLFLGFDNIKTLPLTGKYSHWNVGLVWDPEKKDPLRDLFINNCIKKYLTT